MRFRTTLTLGTLPIITLALALTGCGQNFSGDDDAAETTGAPSNEPALPEPPPIEGDVVSDGEKRTIRFGMGVSEEAPQYIAASYFADVLAERSDGRLTVELYPNGQLGADLEMMEGLQTGTLDMTYPSSAAASNIVRELAVLEFPFQFPTLDAGAHVIEGEVGQRLLGDFEGTGIKALALDEEGYRNLTNNGAPITEPSQVEGLGIRVQESEIHVDIWNALGASPQTMAFGELFTGLEQGTVDAQENPWSTILSSSFDEVQDSASETGHVYLASLILMSQELWDSLGADDQAIVQEAADATSRYKREVSRAYNEWAVDQLRERGMEIEILSAEQRAAFADATAGVREQWSQKVGPELAKAVRSAVDQFEGRN